MQKYKFKQVNIRLKLSQAKPLYSTEPISTAQNAVEMMAGYLYQMDREYCCVINLDASNHPINWHIISIGDTTYAVTPMQNLFKTAILSNAVSIIIMHNHTGGSMIPSKEDIEVTKRAIEAGKLMNIPLLDHIIVAGYTKDKSYSIRENMSNLWDVGKHIAR